MLSSILRHPALQPLKRATKNVWWRYRGRAIVNPPVPARVESVLFVCLGNICRSPFAEVIAAKRANSGSGDIRFMSAGIHTKQAAEPPEHARNVAEMFGVSLRDHRPRMLTRELIDACDMIVVMETSQLELLRTTYSEYRDRVFLLSLFEEGASGLERYAIADPFGLPRAAFEQCFQRIDRAVAALLATVSDRASVSKTLAARSRG